jgi:UDP-N-acetylglucosamine acyltransferase
MGDIHPIVDPIDGLVHPTAVVEPGARVDPSTRVGPYAVIGPQVVIGPGCEIGPHAVIEGQTSLGPENSVGPHAVLGARPQIRDCAARGALIIGARNTLREHVSVHVGSDGGMTRIGDGNLLMVGSHVAHDCVVGDGVELANGVQLAGHVEVGDHAGLGGLAAVHQFVRVGRLAFVGAGAMVSQDVPPFALASGDRARVYDINRVGLGRHGVDGATRTALRRALALLLTAPALRQGMALVREQLAPCAEVDQLLEFAASSRRGLCRKVS